MREILFRGKRVLDYGWSVGYFATAKGVDREVPVLVENSGMRLVMEVDHDTVGQYTGLTDKNGKKIFEGDILKFSYIGENHGVEGKAAVSFENGKFGVAWGWHKDFVCLDGFANTTMEIIGNIYDNPELLKGGADNV